MLCTVKTLKEKMKKEKHRKENVKKKECNTDEIFSAKERRKMKM